MGRKFEIPKAFWVIQKRISRSAALKLQDNKKKLEKFLHPLEGTKKWIEFVRLYEFYTRVRCQFIEYNLVFIPARV